MRTQQEQILTLVSRLCVPTDQLQQQIASLEQENAMAQEQQRLLESDLESTTMDNTTLRAELQDLTNQSADYQKRVAELEAELDMGVQLSQDAVALLQEEILHLKEENREAAELQQRAQRDLEQT